AIRWPWPPASPASSSPPPPASTKASKPGAWKSSRGWSKPSPTPAPARASSGSAACSPCFSARRRWPITPTPAPPPASTPACSSRASSGRPRSSRPLSSAPPTAPPKLLPSSPPPAPPSAKAELLLRGHLLRQLKHLLPPRRAQVRRALAHLRQEGARFRADRRVRRRRRRGGFFVHRLEKP